MKSRARAYTVRHYFGLNVIKMSVSRFFQINFTVGTSFRKYIIEYARRLNVSANIRPRY